MHRAEELADRLGISMRTFYRRLTSGDIHAIDTVSGKRYAVAPHAVVEDESVIRRVPRSMAAKVEPPAFDPELRNRLDTLEAEIKALQMRLDGVTEWTAIAADCIEDLAGRR